MNLFAIAALTLATQFAPTAETTLHEAPAPAPEKTRTFIRAGASHEITLVGRISEIGVETGRERGMEVFLYDQDGNLLACDLDASDGLFLGVRSGWDRPLKLVVRNMSRKANVYAVKAE